MKILFQTEMVQIHRVRGHHWTSLRELEGNELEKVLVRVVECLWPAVWKMDRWEVDMSHLQEILESLLMLIHGQVKQVNSG